MASTQPMDAGDAAAVGERREAVSEEAVAHREKPGAVRGAPSGSQLVPLAAPCMDASAALVPDVAAVALASRFDVDDLWEHARTTLAGPETEKNWQAREALVTRLRGAVKAGVPPELAAPFLQGVRDTQEGLLQCSQSLRTTLAQHTIALIRQLALAHAAALDHTLHFFLPTLLHMAGLTKKLIANASQATAATILACVPMRSAFWQLLLAGLQERSTQVRLHMSRHLGVVLAAHGAALEAHGGVEMLAQCFERALGDASSDVRNVAREAFAKFYALWTERAKQILATLPPATQRLVLASLGQDEAKRTPSRAGPSRTVLAAKRAAAQAHTPRRLPRESVWHPSLVDGNDVSTDLLDDTSPWRPRARDSVPSTPQHGVDAPDSTTPVAGSRVATPQAGDTPVHVPPPAADVSADEDPDKTATRAPADVQSASASAANLAQLLAARTACEASGEALDEKRGEAPDKTPGEIKTPVHTSEAPDAPMGTSEMTPATAWFLAECAQLPPTEDAALATCVARVVGSEADTVTWTSLARYAATTPWPRDLLETWLGAAAPYVSRANEVCACMTC